MPFQINVIGVKMTRYLLLLVLLFSLQADEGDDLSVREIELSSESEPIAIVAGCVNAVSGAFFQVETDLVGNTIDPLRIVRYYDSQSKYEPSLGLGSSLQFPIFASAYQKGARHTYALIGEREGGYLTYQGDYSSSKSTRKFHVDSRLEKSGYTHGGGIKEGAAITNRAAELNSRWQLRTEDGSLRHYGSKSKLYGDAKKRLRLPTQDIYLLAEETKPNGNILTFEYGYRDSIPHLSKITTYNRDRSVILNQVTIDGTPDGYSASSSCGQNVAYRIHKHHGSEMNRTLLNYVSSNQMGHTEYGFKKVKGSDRPVVSTVTKLQGFQQQIEMDDKRRVTKLYHSVGPNNEKVLTHSLTYGTRCTTVHDCLGKHIYYSYDKHDRIVSINYLDKTLVRRDSFVWDEKGWLKSKSVGSDKILYHKKVYEYDERGNVVVESVLGNITGTRTTCFSPSNEDETDKYTIKYEYSKDGFNLLLKSTTPEGLVVSYYYLPGTSLKTLEVESYNGKVQKRVCRKYDLNGEITDLLEDDGKDGLFRRATHYTTIDKPGASYGKRALEECYLVDGDRVLLTKTRYEYDERGNVSRVSVEDGSGKVLSETHKRYNEQNRLIEETDPCGHTICYDYDYNGNRVEERHPSTQTIFRYAYNSTNRLIRKESLYPSEAPRITTYSYDPLGNKTNEVDLFGNETTFRYDSFGNEIGITYPLNATISKKYNILGQKTSEIDERGFETKTEYNIYGKPTRIEYPDGSYVVKEYTLSGLLKSDRYPDGSLTRYDYDPKGHMTKKERLDPAGNVLSRDEYEYRGDLLKSHRDLSGRMTSYEYDKAGRLIKTQVGEKITCYVKDGLGRTVSKIEGDRVESYEYDPMDRVISISRGDGSFEKYTYDANGNKTTVSEEVSHDTFITRLSEYYPDNNLKAEADEEGKKTEWSYGYQNALRITKKEPSGRVTTRLFNARGFVESEETAKDSLLLTKEAYEYDASGNLAKTMVSVIVNGSISRVYTIERQYDSLNRLIALIEGDKITRYEYDALGRKSKTIDPSGVELAYTYDFLDRLISKKSSDGSIEYHFIYDSRGKLIESYDNHFHLKREYDLYDRLTREEFLDGLTVSYTYDLYDRVTEIKLPDNSLIHYVYSPYRLLSLQRNAISLSNLSYDKLGRLLQVGKIAYSYDNLSRKTRIESPTFIADYGPFDLSGNLLQETLTTSSETHTNQFTYDALNALISENTTSYSYDSIGNCLSHNDNALIVNNKNQLIEDADSTYNYDLNGRLTSDSNVQYTYDALGRLIFYSENGTTHCLHYDSFNRCIAIDDTKLIYFGEKEIASFDNNQLRALRLVHPNPSSETTFLIESQGSPYLAVQDNRNNIVQLLDSSGKLIQHYQYTAFKEITSLSPISPWRYANRRQLDHLTLYTHRLYHQGMRRWLTPDPLDFEDGYNLYRFVHNNPYRYLDRDGRFAFMLPILSFTFELGVSMTPLFSASLSTAIAVTAVTATYCGVKAIDQKYGTNIAGSLFQQGNFVMNSELLEEVPLQEEEETKENEVKAPAEPKYKFETNEENQETIEGLYSLKGHTEPKSKYGVKAPDSDTPHTQIWRKKGKKGWYTKAREWGYKGKWKMDIDFTNHGIKDHPCPHVHVAEDNPTGGTERRGNQAPDQFLLDYFSKFR